MVWLVEVCLPTNSQKNVGEDGPKFLKIVQRGNVSAEELNSLESSFNMRKFPQKSNEKELIIELLLQKIIRHPNQNFLIGRQQFIVT